MDEIRLTLDAQATPTATGEFEIVAITAGEGNGWKFPAEALQKSLSLWQGVSSFVDHSFFGHSLRDLGGVGINPRWDPADQGIHLTLRPGGPSGPLMRAIAQEMLSDGPKPRIGFSADISFTGSAREVKDILRVYSLDLVFDPARGGAFVRALNSLRPPTDDRRPQSAVTHREIPMPEQAVPPAVGGAPQLPPTGSSGMPSAVSVEHRALQQLLGVAQQQEQIAAEAQAARELRIQMCGYLLHAGLSASRLPAPMQDHLRKQFANVVFEPAALADAIEDARTLVSTLAGPGTVKGPKGQVSGMFSSDDMLEAAVDDLFRVDRPDNRKGLKTARLTGLRELYLMLTGDDDLHGGFYPQRVRLATTADFTGLVVNRLNKIAVNQWDQLGKAGYDWWTYVTVQEHFDNLNLITGTLIGTVGTLPTVAEQGEYTELVVGDSPETASFVKYGGYIPLTLELIDRDDLRKLLAYPRELANAALRRISALVAAVFTDNAGAGPTMADTGALFNSTAVTTAGGHLNLLTTALSAAQWEIVGAAIYNQPQLIKNAAGIYGTGPKMGVDPRYLLVPRALRLTAKQILYPSLERAATIYSENQQRQQDGDVITVPEWTDVTDFAAVADPRIAPAIFVGDRFGLMPEIFIAGDQLSPAVFMNDESRMKVRLFVAVWVNDFRPLHKSNVAG